MPTPLLPLFLAACAPKTFPEDALPTWEERPVTATYNAEFDQVWDAALQVMGDAAPLDEIAKSDGVITTSWVTDFSDYIFKSYGGTRIPEPVRWRMSLRVAPEGQRTLVTMTAREQVEKDMISSNLDFTGAVFSWIDVPSSTSKELSFLDDIQQAVSNPGSSTYDYDDYAR